MYTPDLLTFQDGTPVSAPAQWTARRAELLDILSREEYGMRPAYAGHAEYTLREVISPCCAGHARHECLTVSFDTPGRVFSFPLQLLYPADGQAHPLIVSLSFHREVYNQSTPA